MFQEHVERSFLDPKYSFDEYFQLDSRRKVGPIKNQLASPNTSNKVREETFTQLRTGFTEAGKQEGLGLILALQKVVVCGQCLETLSLTINEALKWLSSLPIAMQEPFLW